MEPPRDADTRREKWLTGNRHYVPGLKGDLRSRDIYLAIC
jgi:hypothetical protein